MHSSVVCVVKGDMYKSCCYICLSIAMEKCIFNKAHQGSHNFFIFKIKENRAESRKNFPKNIEDSFEKPWEN